MALWNNWDDEEEDPTQVPPPQPQPAIEGPATTAPAAPGMPSLKDLLLKKYADAGAEGDKNIQGAQNRALAAQAFSGLAEAAEGVARAPGIARGGPGVNHAAYQQRNAQAQGLVDKARAGKASTQDNILKQHVLGKQLDDEQHTAEARDPNSDVSKNFRSFVQSTYPDLKLPDGMSYADAKEKIPMIASAHEAQETKKAIAQQKIDEAKYRADSIAENKRQFNVDRSDREKTKADQKEYDRAQHQLSELKNDLNGVRGNSVRTEKNKLFSAQHAKQIIEAHPDLNGLSQLEVQELGAAMASQLSGGGHAAESVIHNMTPSTLKGDFSRAMGYMTGGPQPANQGDYVKLFKDMIDRQMQTSKDIIANEYDPAIARHMNLANHKDPGIKEQALRILQSGGVTTDSDGRLTAYNPNLTRSRNTAVAAKGGEGTALAAPATEQVPQVPVIPQAHPDAAVAIAWANDPKNAHDPRAAQIKDSFKRAAPTPGPIPTPGG